MCTDEQLLYTTKLYTQTWLAQLYYCTISAFVSIYVFLTLFESQIREVSLNLVIKTVIKTLRNPIIQIESDLLLHNPYSSRRKLG